MNSYMETLEQKKRRLFGKANYLPRYLEELSRLLNRSVTANELLSIVDTDVIHNRMAHFRDEKPYYKTTMGFSDKTKLKEILKREILNWDMPYYMYLSDSLDGGLKKLSSLHEFNMDFSMHDEHSGVIIFIRIDGKEKILFDYGEKKVLNVLN